MDTPSTSLAAFGPTLALISNRSCSRVWHLTVLLLATSCFQECTHLHRILGN